MGAFIATLVVALHEYFFGSVTLIHTMYSLHRFEFKRHACRMILLFISILVSILNLLLRFYFTIVVSSCLVAQANMGVNERMDLCFAIFPVNLGVNVATILYTVFLAFELLPFLFYFVLNQPHDCFVCLGKDPDRRFS